MHGDYGSESKSTSCTVGWRWALLVRVSTLPVASLPPEPADLGAAPERAELDSAGPEHELVVPGSDGGADQRAHPEDPLQVRTHDSEWRWSQLSTQLIASMECINILPQFFFTYCWLA
jgi:hypothetical protein